MGYPTVYTGLLAAWLATFADSAWEQAPTDPDVACLEVELEASREYGPEASHEDLLSLGMASVFTLPEALEVEEGSPGSGLAVLAYSLGGGPEIECVYVGDGQASYRFSACDDHTVPGEWFTADQLRLSVVSGDASEGTTKIEVELEEDTCEDLQEGPCAGDGWGGITYLQQTVHVRDDGDDSGDGSLEHPVATVARAVEITRSWGAIGKKVIAVGPGAFDGGISLDQPADDLTFLQGCSVEETWLSVPDLTGHVLDFAVNADMGVSSMTLSGGQRSLRVRDGAVTRVSSVVVQGFADAGVEVQDRATMAELVEVQVREPAPSAGCGWGVDARDALFVMTGGGVQGATEAGVVGRDLLALITDVDVNATKARPDGRRGRGLHLQDSWSLVSNARFNGNMDAGMFVLDPRGGLIDHIVIDFTGAGFLPTGATSGDGVVLAGQNKSALPYAILRTDVTDNERAGALIDGIDAYVAQNYAIDNGLFGPTGGEVYCQGFAAIGGPQAGDVVDISASPVELDLDPLTCP